MCPTFRRGGLIRRRGRHNEPMWASWIFSSNPVTRSLERGSKFKGFPRLLGSVIILHVSWVTSPRVAAWISFAAQIKLAWFECAGFNPEGARDRSSFSPENHWHTSSDGLWFTFAAWPAMWTKWGIILLELSYSILTLSTKVTNSNLKLKWSVYGGHWSACHM